LSRDLSPGGRPAKESHTKDKRLVSPNAAKTAFANMLDLPSKLLSLCKGHKTLVNNIKAEYLKWMDQPHTNVSTFYFGIDNVK
jgi:hypothetical protein